MNKKNNNHTVTPTNDDWETLCEMASVMEGQGKFKIRKGGDGVTQLLTVIAREGRSYLASNKGG